MITAHTNIITMEPDQIRARILAFNDRIPLRGINTPERLNCLVHQIDDSIKRVNHITVLRNTIHSPSCIDPNLESFNPLIAAAYHKQQGNMDEAFWLVFLAIHFGEAEDTTGWQLVKDVYGRLGNSVVWNWERVCSDIKGFRLWLQANNTLLKSRGNFGNHRKYESLKSEHTGQTIASYIDWIGPEHKHLHFIKGFGEAEPHLLFDVLYKSMEAVWRFGRTSKFDYLCTLGKMGLVNIEPGSPYLQDATGPLTGARLLFGNMDTKALNQRLWKFGVYLDLPFVMQILEDSVCNWQKSPDIFVSFLR